MNETPCTFYGKYRGIVTDNKDPLMAGRIRAKVPDVMGDQESGWALPCAPFGGSDLGFFALPDEGSFVWIEFEHGDADYPIWCGCWWDTFTAAVKDMPKKVIIPPPASSKVMIKTKGGNSILIDDTPGIGGITLETSKGQKIVLSMTGVEITNGLGASIKMVGPKVSINGNALEVI